MKNNRHPFAVVMINGLSALLMVLVMASCATTIPELQVQYRLPTPSDTLKGRAVALAIEDRRTTQSILGKGAMEEFGGSSNSVALSVAEPNQNASNIGIFQVPSLMREAITRNLERSGVKVLSDQAAGAPGLVIVLKEFSLDLVGREWTARISYDARLTGEGGSVATQSINGKAERYKVIGRDSADTLMSEIFTDMVNSLNLARLFEQTGL